MTKSKAVTGGATSAGNARHKVGSRDICESKFVVENGLVISAEELRRSVNAGIDYFWSRRHAEVRWVGVRLDDRFGSRAQRPDRAKLPA